MAKQIRVIKLGGSALASGEALENLSAVVSKHLTAETVLLVVTSATDRAVSLLEQMSRAAEVADESYERLLDDYARLHRNIVQDRIEPHRRADALAGVDSFVTEIGGFLRGVALVREISPKTRDAVFGLGEVLASRLLFEILEPLSPGASFLDARRIVKTNDFYEEAEIDIPIFEFNLKHELDSHADLYLLAGGVGGFSEGVVTTLGKGGVSQTAALAASAIGADEIEIWTRVDGFMTADPAKVKKAFSLPRLTYAEAMELSRYGAHEVLSSRMQPAMDAGIPIRIRNILNPAFPGTLISSAPLAEQFSVTGVSSISGVALVTLQETSMATDSMLPMRLFRALAEERINILLIAQASSEHSLSVAAPLEQVERAVQAIEREFELEIEAGRLSPVSVEAEHSIIAVVGANMIHTPGIAGKLFQALGKNGVNVTVIAQGSSELNISAVIAAEDELKALNALHDAFFLSDLKTVHLFTMGTGWVGGALLNQLRDNTARFAERKLEFRVVAVANSRRMLFNSEGISLVSWKEDLMGSLEETDIDRYLDRMKSLNLPNSVFVDCTASDYLALQYESILRASISVVTSSKKANSGPLDIYERLKKTAAKANVKYYYETNVGAGLPVISTLNDLILSGDKILRIEAVLSGTLSFIFNSLIEGKRFSQIVREAKERGYTEPDPRDDLSGLDVVRKLLILAREAGIPLEEKDILVEKLVPDAVMLSGSTEEFLAKLETVDKEFEEKRFAAAKENRKLCYFGTIEDKKAAVVLRAVDMSHPFYTLSGSDNMISFVTKRYAQRPLVVKGPGAGDDVTAAGVLADIIRVASYL